VPELPEVETMRRGVATVAGCRIEEIQRPACRLRPIQFRPRFAEFRRRVMDREIAAVERLGKRVLLRLDDQSTIVIEPRMTGLVLLGDPPGEEHLRLRMGLRPAKGHSEPRQLLFWDRRGLGTVTLLGREEWDARLGPQRIGPDALTVDGETLRARLRHSRRAIKVALLDQRAIAGIGNLYAAEILHVAEVDPRVACARLTRRQWEAIAAATRRVLEEAIRYEGSTLADGTYRNALNAPGSYQSHHRVYDREAHPCPRCGAAIRRIVQAQRSTFFCPACQHRRSPVRRPTAKKGAGRRASAPGQTLQ
jgi:formamidopyrimidine-DNA glycosylase